MTAADEDVDNPSNCAHLVGRARELVPDRDDRSSSGQETIVLIDDSVTFREELKRALEQAAYHVVVAGRAEEGLRLVEDIRPSGIIVDGELPGMDGATFIRRIRLDAALSGLPCFMLTGSEDRSAVVRALDAGADGFAVKEESIGVILARVGAMLRRARNASARGTPTGLQRPKKVLAVDDSETYLQQLANALRPDGCEVILARSGEDALELLAVQQVDCVLLDLLMPGIGGPETCRRVKCVPAMRDTPVIMLTPVEDREAMIDGLSAGADDYIAKSSDFDVVRARVLAQIRRKQFDDEGRAVRHQLLQTKYEANEARTALEVAQSPSALVDELKLKNDELESFSYSLTHELRAPLRSIDGFTLALLEDCGEKLSEDGKQYLRYVRESAQHMARLIDDLLALSRVTRAELDRAETDLSSIARSVAARLAKASPDRQVELLVTDRLVANCDGGLLTIVFENLIGNAWKFTSKRSHARIEVGATAEHAPTYFVRDNGAGFDMSYRAKLFGVFQRLHSVAEFEGTGIGLATVQRIIRRHGGRIWAEGEIGCGATFFFTLENGSHVGVDTPPPPSPTRTKKNANEEVAV
jgi:two-component system, NtrC family, sensor kinase